MDLFSYMLGKKSGGSDSGGGSGESVDAEKLDLYERYFRAAAGESFQDWNPQPINPNETATFEEAPEKYYIEVETRGIKYRVTGDVAYAAIYPEFVLRDRLTDPGPAMPQYFLPTVTKQTVVDMSRLHNVKSNGDECDVRFHGFGAEGSYPQFVALPDRCALSNLAFCLQSKEGVFSQGISFGRRVYGMNANTFYYSLLNLGDIPVYVMEGFDGTLYLAKLNISAEHIIGIINNLTDMTGTGYTNRLNIGSHNIAKLTDEQIAIAEQKGWIVE